MRDALFQGYAGAAFTHSSGGGLLEPADFHGVAALLIKNRVKGSKRRQQKALQRLMDPVKGNPLVQVTLTPGFRSEVHDAGDIHGWGCENCMSAPRPTAVGWDRTAAVVCVRDREVVSRGRVRAAGDTLVKQ